MKLVVEEWNKISQELIQKLADSILELIVKVFQKHVRVTSYLLAAHCYGQINCAVLLIFVRKNLILFFVFCFFIYKLVRFDGIIMTSLCFFVCSVTMYRNIENLTVPRIQWHCYFNICKINHGPIMFWGSVFDSNEAPLSTTII